MHGIEKITDRIAQDAQAELEAQLSQAQERADQILAEYETQAREAVERYLKRKKGFILASHDRVLLDACVDQREVDAHRAQLHSMARLEARKRILAAKQDVIEAAFEKALARLCALPREKMVPLLARLAAVYAETGEEEVILPPASRRAYGQDVVDQANQLIGEGHLTLGPAEEGIAGGLLLRRGPVDINCTFSMLLQRRRESLSAQVAEILFPRGEQV